jgi:hypothetical protein
MWCNVLRCVQALRKECENYNRVTYPNVIAAHAAQNQKQFDESIASALRPEPSRL